MRAYSAVRRRHRRPGIPSGGFHIYDVTGANERAPVDVGYWNIDDADPKHAPENTCTARSTTAAFAWSTCRARRTARG
jgi:hypothetical protein